MKLNPPKIIFFVLLIIASISIGRILSSGISEYKQVYRSGKFIVYRTSDVLGITSTTATVNADYAQQISTGSPLVFGGAHAPLPEHQDAWNKITAAGVTAIRKDFLLEYFFHKDTTLESYKANVNGIQDVTNWNKANIASREIFFDNARSRNLTTIAIVSYAPSWLTYSGTTFGVPKDWDVYKDIVKKAYKYFRPKIDYIEIWNEPDHPRFLDLKNSGMSKEQAYANIYYYASTAIREVDAEMNDGKRIPIGGPTLSNVKNNTILQTILVDPRTANNIDFVSYHYYGVNDDALPIIQKTLLSRGRQDLPVFVTEWSFATNIGRPSPNTNTYLAIPFTSKRLIYYLTNGIKGTSYHVIEPVNAKNSNIDQEKYAFYRWTNDQATLLPQSKSWILLSKTLGLGNGDSRIFLSTGKDLAAQLAFKNSRNETGIILVNDEYSPKEVTVNINNPPYKGYVRARAYVASNIQDGFTLLGAKSLTANTTLSMKIAVPEQSVVGILFDTNRTIEGMIKDLIQ